MAISRLTTPNKWIELASSSPTTGSTVSFTGLAQYDKYRIVLWGLDSTLDQTVKIRLNNIATNSYAKIFTGVSEVDAISTLGGALYGEIIIYYANHSAIKTIDVATSTSAQEEIEKWLFNSSAIIDRIDLLIGSGTFNSGTITVYGSN